jgi:hypothetical protein
VGDPCPPSRLRQHYAAFRIAERLLELLKPITSDTGQEGDDVGVSQVGGVLNQPGGGEQDASSAFIARTTTLTRRSSGRHR